MKHKSNAISMTAALLFMVQAVTFGQKTEVSVLKGKVVAQTAAGSATVEAGRKAVLDKNEIPAIFVDDPMVADVMKMYQWIEEEKQAKREHIDFASIQIKSIESETLLKGATFFEIPNLKSISSDNCRIGLTSILNKPKYYDLEGNLLKFDLEKVNEQQGYYYLHFLKVVEPGQKFESVNTYEYTVSKELWKEGSLWHLQLGNCTPNCLNYFKIILPKSAIFVNASRPILMIDNENERIALTIRNYTGAYADGMYHVTFLWPEKDGTSIGELPIQYLGLKKPAETNNIASADYYEAKLSKILAGEMFADQNTPVNAMLTLACALVTRDKDIFKKVSFSCIDNPQTAESLFGNPEIVNSWKAQLIDQQDFLSTPCWPQQPQQHYIHPIYICYKSSTKRSDTLAFIYQDGKWYSMGNMGNENDTDVNAFRKFIPQTPESKIESLPWDKAGSEVNSVYEEFIQNNVADGGGWCDLGIKLVGGGYWIQAKDSFERCNSLSKEPLLKFAALVWQGHIYDVLGDREKAISKYNEALKIEPESRMRHDQWGIVLNYKWVKERLEKPFTKEMIGK